MKSICILTAMIGISIVASSSIANAGETPPSQFVTQLTPPQPKVLAAVERVIAKAKGQSQYKDEWKVCIDKEKGTLETNWFPVFKGEVLLKIQVVVWGAHFHVDVWQQSGWLSKTVAKSDSSRRSERGIQEAIEIALHEEEQPNKTLEPTVAPAPQVQR